MKRAPNAHWRQNADAKFSNIQSIITDLYEYVRLASFRYKLKWFRIRIGFRFYEAKPKQFVLETTCFATLQIEIRLINPRK